MSRSDRDRLADILDAASELAPIVESGVDRFRSDPIARRAAERLLEIIGEAPRPSDDSYLDRLTGGR